MTLLDAEAVTRPIESLAGIALNDRWKVVELVQRQSFQTGSIFSVGVACTRFRRHRVRCFDGSGGVSWRDGSLHASSSLRLCG
jgi:hypothetical protein